MNTVSCGCAIGMCTGIDKTNCRNPTVPTIPLSNYLNQAIASFDRDPPDNEYQRGYLAALVEVYRVNCRVTF